MKLVIVLKNDCIIDGQHRVAGEIVIVEESFDRNLIRRVVRVIYDNNSNTNSN